MERCKPFVFLGWTRDSFQGFPTRGTRLHTKRWKGIPIFRSLTRLERALPQVRNPLKRVARGHLEGVDAGIHLFKGKKIPLALNPTWTKTGSKVNHHVTPMACEGSISQQWIR